jgi:hypothetical protein
VLDNQQDSGNNDETTQNSVALELVFISFIGLVVIGAFVAALNYDFVSARAPLVIMVPLLILIGMQFNKISVFMFVLMHWVSKERPILALPISVGVTVLIYFLFEHGFNIELYRGYIPNLLSS